MSSGPSHPSPRPADPHVGSDPFRRVVRYAPPYLFVYGLLQSRFVKNRYSRLLARSADLMGAASMAGRLYGLARYPGLRPAQVPEDRAEGELYRLRSPVAVLQLLDDYEGANYRRVIGHCRFGDREIRCWVYLYHIALPEHRRIPDGKWPMSS